MIRRLRKLEESFAPKQNEQEIRLATMLRERLCRLKAQERGVPYEQVLQESITQSRVLMEGYAGDGTIADTMRFIRRRKRELQKRLEATPTT